MPLILVHFARFGPYHHARLWSVADALAPLGWEVVGLETAGTDATYAWDETSGGAFGPRVITAFPGRVYEEITVAECKRVLHPLLEKLEPGAMAIAGWGGADALSCLSWCRKHDVKRIVMSETREADGRRVWWKEWIKRYLISRFDAALVGGRSQRDYLVKLGMPANRIQFGYNVVDNEYFAEKSQDFKTQDTRQETSVERRHEDNSSSQFSAFAPKYFLASNRFIERKNLSRLIEAYALYAHSKSNIQHSQFNIWPLCLLGDGELKGALIAQCQQLGLNVVEGAPWEERKQEAGSMEHEGKRDISQLPPHAACLPPHALCSSPTVFFPGFRQIEELPRFYAHAGCFVHPALEEPWGLVINEAMACGLPILSSDNVGAAEELVDNGINGWRFDAENIEQMSQRMSEISAVNFPLFDFGDASRCILQERCPTVAFGRGLADLLR